VGRVVADGTDEDGARAAKMDEWMVWETVAPRGEGQIVILSFFVFTMSLL
jgi:hypothetical protein